jgi:poly(hydroxyalkanoate) depolymerase family esterase
VHLGPAGSRTFFVYLPPRLRRRTRVPAVLLLHGCTQDATGFAEASRFTAGADRNGFLLVVPQQESHYHVNRCWRWYETAHQHRGAGEPALLAGIVRQVLAEQVRWRIDPRRVYAAGLSAGGAMALVLAATYPDVVAAVGVHSAPAYRSATGAGQALSAMAGQGVPPPPVPERGMAPVVVVQGRADTVVAARNGDAVTEQWLASAAAVGDAADRVARSRTTRGHTGGRSWTATRWYTARGRKALERWVVDDLGHAWSGGLADAGYSDPAGPRAATLMWQFFRLHRLRAVAATRASA